MGYMDPPNLKGASELQNGPCIAVCANGKTFEAKKTDGHVYFTIPHKPGYEVLGYLQELNKPALSDRIHAAEQKVSVQHDDTPEVFLFREDRSGDRMGKPSDSNNVYHAEWYEFYSVGESGQPQHESTSLNFYDNFRWVPGGNNLGEVDAFWRFGQKHPGHKVVVLNIEYSNKDLAARIADAVTAYEADQKAFMVQPAMPLPTSQKPLKEPSR